MKTRNEIIIALALIGVVLFSVMLMFRNQQSAKEESYNQAQQEVTTHDLQSILPYKNRYMGNASNNINLFYNLPLSDFNKDFSQNPNTFTLEINFKGKSTDIEDTRMKKEIIYSSVSAFALIGNLQTLKYNYMDKTYLVKRSNIENQYGNLQNMLNESSWHTMQEKLKDNNYIHSTFQRISQS